VPLGAAAPKQAPCHLAAAVLKNESERLPRAVTATPTGTIPREEEIMARTGRGINQAATTNPRNGPYFSRLPASAADRLESVGAAARRAGIWFVVGGGAGFATSGVTGPPGIVAGTALGSVPTGDR